MAEKFRFVPFRRPGQRPFPVPLLLLVFLALFQATASAQAPVPERLRRRIEKIDALAEAEHAKDNVGSLTIGVVAEGKLVWTKSYGWADRNRNPGHAGHGVPHRFDHETVHRPDAAAVGAGRQS